MHRCMEFTGKIQTKAKAIQFSVLLILQPYFSQFVKKKSKWRKTILQKRVHFAQHVIAKDFSRQDKKQSNKQTSRRLVLMCDKSKKNELKNWIKSCSHTPSPTQKFNLKYVKLQNKFLSPNGKHFIDIQDESLYLFRVKNTHISSDEKFNLMQTLKEKKTAKDITFRWACFRPK